MLSVGNVRRRLSNDPRLGRILHGSISGLAGRGAALLVSAITLPLTVRYLGALEYGVWVTISTSVVMLAVLDLGIANTLTNFISKAYSAGDNREAQRYFSTAFWLTAVVVLLLAIISFAGWYEADWGKIFHLSNPLLIAHARACAGISICFFLVGLPLGLANRVLSGYQEMHLSNYFAMVNSVLGLIAIVLVIAMKGSIVALMGAFCAAMLTGSLALNIWLFFWNKPFLKPLPWLASRQLAKSFLEQGSLFFLLQLSTLVVFNSDNIVITHYLGASEVTPYSVAWRLTSYASMMQSLLIPSLWPAFSEAYHRRDMEWVRKIYHNTNRSSLIAVGAIALVMGIAGRTVIRFWAGPSAVPSATLLWCMAFWALLVSVTTNQALLLTATGRLKLEAAAAILAAAANLYLSVHLVTRLGSVGVIASTIISFLVIMVGPQQWEVNRVLAGTYLPELPIAGKEARTVC